MRYSDIKNKDLKCVRDGLWRVISSVVNVMIE